MPRFASPTAAISPSGPYLAHANAAPVALRWPSHYLMAIEDSRPQILMRHHRLSSLPLVPNLGVHRAQKTGLHRLPGDQPSGNFPEAHRSTDEGPSRVYRSDEPRHGQYRGSTSPASSPAVPPAAARIVASGGFGAAGIRQMPSRRTAAVAIKINRYTGLAGTAKHDIRLGKPWRRRRSRRSRRGCAAPLRFVVLAADLRLRHAARSSRPLIHGPRQAEEPDHVVERGIIESENPLDLANAGTGRYQSCEPLAMLQSAFDCHDRPLIDPRSALSYKTLRCASNPEKTLTHPVANLKQPGASGDPNLTIGTEQF